MTFEVAPRSPSRAVGLPASWPAFVVAAIAAAAVWIHLAAPLTSDVSWFLTVCERMLGGQRLYLDIDELNPPMSVWLYMPWVWAAARLGVPAELATILAVVGLALASIALSARVLDRAGRLESPAAWWIVSSLVLLVAPVAAFAQREHFAVIAALPALAALASRAAGVTPEARFRIAAGLCAGLVVAIKPFFALAIILPAVQEAVIKRSIRPLRATQHLIGASVAFAYLGAAMALHPAYFTDVAPLVAAVYVPSRLPFEVLASSACVVAFALALGGFLLSRPELARQPPFATVALAAAGFAAAYVIQGHGWAYHMLPAYLLALLLLGLGLASAPPFRSAAQKALAVSVALFLAGQSAIEFEGARQVNEPYVQALAPMGPGVRLGVISSEIMYGSPLHRLIGATLVNRNQSLWAAGNAATLCAGSSDRVLLANCAAAVARDRRQLLEDFERMPPDAIIVESPAADRWARVDPELATILDGYRPIAEIAERNGPATVLRRVGG